MHWNRTAIPGSICMPLRWHCTMHTAIDIESNAPNFMIEMAVADVNFGNWIMRKGRPQQRIHPNLVHDERTGCAHFRRAYWKKNRNTKSSSIHIWCYASPPFFCVCVYSSSHFCRTLCCYNTIFRAKICTMHKSHLRRANIWHSVAIQVLLNANVC